MARPNRSQDQFYNPNSKQATKRSKKNFKTIWFEYLDRQSFPPMTVNYTENGKFSFNKQAAVFDPCVGSFELNPCKDGPGMPKKKFRQFDQNTPRLEERFPQRTWRSRLGTDRDASGSSLVPYPDTPIASIPMLPAANSSAYSPGNSQCENQWSCGGQIYYAPYLPRPSTNAQSSDADVWTTNLSNSSLPAMSYFSKCEQVEKVKFEELEYDESKLNNEDSKKAAMEFHTDEDLMEIDQNCHENGDLYPHKDMAFSAGEENYRENPFVNENDFEFQNCSSSDFRNVAETRTCSAPNFQNLPPFDPKFSPVKRSRKWDRRKKMISPSSDTFRTPRHCQRNDGFNYLSNYPQNSWMPNGLKFRSSSDKFFHPNGKGSSYSNETFLQTELPLDVNNPRFVYQKRQNKKKNNKQWNDSSLDSCENCYNDAFSLGENFPPSDFGRSWGKSNLYSGSIKRNKKNYRWGSNVAPGLGYKAYNEKWKTQGFSAMKRFNPADNIQWRARNKSAFNYPKRGKRMISSDKNYNIQSSIQIPVTKNFDLLYNNCFYPFSHPTNSFNFEDQSKELYNDPFNNRQNSPFPKSNKFRRKMNPSRLSEFRWRQKLPTRNFKATTFRNKNTLLKFEGNRQDIDWPSFNSKHEGKNEAYNVGLKSRVQHFPWNSEPRAKKNLLRPSDGKSLSRTSHIPTPWVSFEALSPFDLLLSTKNQFISLPSDGSPSNSLVTVDAPARLFCPENIPAFVQREVFLANSLPLALPLKSEDQLSANLTSIGLLLSSPVSPLRLGLCHLSTLEEDSEDRDEISQLAENSSSAEPSLNIIQRAESPKFQ